MKRIVGLLSLMLASTLAQNPEEVLEALRHTDHLIAEARPRIVESGNREAEGFLQEAEARQEQAWSLYEARAYRMALGRTRSARTSLYRALELAKFDPERIREEIRRTQEFMHEVGPRVLRSGVPRALELWRMAEGEQDAARRHFEQRHFRLALKFAIAARLHARRAHDLVRGGRSIEKVEQEVERTDMLLDRAREKAAGVEDEQARELLRRATGWQEEAVAELRGGDPVLALKMTLAARDLLLRAWERARGGVEPELVERALEETRQLVERWQAEIREMGPDEARDMLDNAVEYLGRADGLSAARDLPAAWREASLARRMLNRAIELVRSRGPAPDGQ